MVVKFLQEHLKGLGFTSRLANHEIRKGDEKKGTRSQKNMAKRVRVTRRGGKDAPERRNGIGEDDRQPIMARIAGQSKRFNLATLVKLRKENHLGEALVRTGRKKVLYKKGTSEEAS